MKILNLFAGAGGNRKCWDGHDITAVEYYEPIAEVYRKRFPQDELIIGDVYRILEQIEVNDYDFIWASPPCQTHTQMRSFHGKKVPDLRGTLGLKVFLDYEYRGYYAIENVKPFYKIPKMWMFNSRIGRHVFWTNFPLKSKEYSGGYLIMRGKIRELAEYHDFDFSLLDRFPIRKRIVLRNMVHYNIGKYVLNTVEKLLCD